MWEISKLQLFEFPSQEIFYIYNCQKTFKEEHFASLVEISTN